MQGGSSVQRTYYYTKDIQYLLHEPLLIKLREYKIFARKLGKLIGKREWSEAKRLEQNKPVYTLDHIIKERYPSFVDAVRDLDDSLSMVFLFSTLPQTDNITADIGAKCRQLAAEFQMYCIKKRLLRKVFLSIKGIYYQIELMGQTITWIVPYEFSQMMPIDVDFRVMLTFLEFYETLLGFVNFKLFTDLELNYPPVIDNALDDGNGGLNALIFQTAKLNVPEVNENGTEAQIDYDLEALNSKIKSVTNKEEDEEKEDDEEEASNEDIPEELALFSKMNIFLSREVPRFSLEFVLRCFGGRVGWACGLGSPFSEEDSIITHQIVDRPSLAQMYPNRIYIQPQWVYDCINAKKVLPVEPYRVGATLPPHLSPFVDQIDNEDGFGDRAEPIVDSSDEEMEPTEDALQKEQKELALSMMSKKQRKLYNQIQYGKNKKIQEEKKLMDKRKAISQKK